VLTLVTIALLAITLWLSLNRRRTALQLAVGVSLLMIVERRVVIHEQGTLASSAHNPQVAQSVLGQLLNGFFVLTAWVLGVALAVGVITVLMGPYRWAWPPARRSSGRGAACGRQVAVTTAARSAGWPLTRLVSSWAGPSSPGSCF